MEVETKSLTWCLTCESVWVSGVRSLWLQGLSLNRKSQQVSYLMCVRSCKQASGRCERGFRESLGKQRVSRGQWVELWGISETEVLGGRGTESCWAEDWPWDSLGERGPYQAGAGIPKWLWLGFGWLFKNKDTRLTPEEESPALHDSISSKRRQLLKNVFAPGCLLLSLPYLFTITSALKFWNKTFKQMLQPQQW